MPSTVPLLFITALGRVEHHELAVSRTPHVVGDIEVFNPRVVHRGSPNKTATPRWVLAFTFEPVARVVEHGSAGGGSPSIGGEALATLSGRAQRMVRLLPRL